MISKEKAAAFSLENSQNLSDFLAANFPQTIKDGTLNLKAIAALLGINTNEKFQGYELTFPGKGIANELYKSPTKKELKLTTPHAANSLIIGDNLDALKILKSAYDSRVKMIYIDPPYNTKNENFIYPDDFKADEIFAELNIDKEAQNFFKNITGTRSHTGWLAFMLPRLKLARDLLRDDGVIFISIDDNEQANLKLLCDEIFGEENFVACLSVENNPKGRKNSKFVSVSNEYCLIYTKDINDKNSFFVENFPKSNLKKDEQGRLYSNGQRVIVGESSNNKIENFDNKKHYSVYYNFDLDDLIIEIENNILDKNLNLIKAGYKRYISSLNGYFIENTYTKDRFIELFNDKALIFNDITIYEKDFNQFSRIKSLLINDIKKGFDYKTETANKDLKELGIPFSYPKNIAFLKTLINLLPTSDAANPDIVLDFFAGSGTTAHAVMALNAADGGNRQFILVQLPELISEQKSKTAYDFVKNELGKGEPKISDITAERIKRAGKKLKESTTNAALDTGFAIYELGDKPRIEGQGTDLALQDHRSLTPLDLARNLATKAGVALSAPLEVVIKDELFRHKTQLFVVAFSDAVLEVIKSSKEGDIFIDAYAFSDDDFEVFLNILANADKRLKVVY